MQVVCFMNRFQPPDAVEFTCCGFKKTGEKQEKIIAGFLDYFYCLLHIQGQWFHAVFCSK